MNCYIFCNMFPALVSDIARAPGLRAEQLAHQAKPHFENVRYVMTRSRYNMLTNSNHLSHIMRSHPDFLVIDDTKMNDFLNRLEPSVFVFSQVEMASVLSSEMKKHRVVYDILAPKVLELRCGGAKQEEIQIAQSRHSTFLKRADRILVNGAKNLELFQNDLENRAQVVLNPFCPLPPADQKVPRDHIMFFAGAQKWTDNAPFLLAMADLLEHRDDLNVLFLAPLKHHEDPESVAISRLIQYPNLRRVSSLTYPAHLQLLRRCAGVLDWSTVNEERVYSTSTRLIQAVSCGAAIFGNADTGLDHFWGEYPGTTSHDAPTAAQLETFIDQALAGEFSEHTTRAANWIAQTLGDPAVFGDLS